MVNQNPLNVWYIYLQEWLVYMGSVLINIPVPWMVWAIKIHGMFGDLKRVFFWYSPLDLIGISLDGLESSQGSKCTFNLNTEKHY